MSPCLNSLEQYVYQIEQAFASGNLGSEPGTRVSRNEKPPVSSPVG